MPLAAARELLARAARGVAPDGPASLGVLALDGGLSDPSGPGSRSDEVVHALWWLIVELADEQPLALFLDDAQWADELTLRLLRLAARRARELPLALVVAARPAAPGHAHAVLAAERAFVRLEPAPLSVAGTARLVEAVLGRPGSVGLVARARALTRGNPLYLSRAAAGGARARLGPDERRVRRRRRAAAARAARRGSARAAVAGRDHARARRRGAGGRRRRQAGRARSPGSTRAEAIAAEEELRDERVLDAARVRLHPPGGRGGGARGDRPQWTRPSCMRARPRCSPTTAWTISASPSTWCARRRAVTLRSWRRCAVPPRRRDGSAR